MIDEEANRLVENELRRQNDQKLEIIADQVAQMRSVSKHLGTPLEDEKPMLQKIEGGLDRSKSALYRVMNNMDGMLSRAS